MQRSGFFVVFFIIVAVGIFTSDEAVSQDADGDGSVSMAFGGDDCDDNDAGRFPGNTEVCDAGHVDEDCDSLTFGFRDGDGDGFPDASCCNMYRGSLRCGSDCDDHVAFVHPIQVEVCNYVDDNCDGLIDEMLGTSFRSYTDQDGDGYGGRRNILTGRSSDHLCPGAFGYTNVGGDCDDMNPNIFVGSMVCIPAHPTDITVCGSNGAFMKAKCPDGSKCFTQPNGTGVCHPEDKGATIPPVKVIIEFN